MQLARAVGRVARRLRFGWLALLVVLGGAAGVAAGATLDGIRQTGTLRLGYLEDARPFSYVDEAGKPAGYAVALCEKIAAAAREALGKPGLRTEFVAVPSPDRLAAVKQGKVDLMCAAGAVTLSGREQADFSIPAFPGGIGALLRKDAPERMRAILAGEPHPKRPVWRASLGQILEKRKFAVVASSPTQTWLEKQIDEFEIIATIEPVAEIADGVEAVVKRRADVFFSDRATLLDASKRSPAADELVVLPREFTYAPYAMAMQRGADDLRLLVDRTLSRLYRSGEIDAIYTRFFGKPSGEVQVFFQHTALPE